ncbi:uncharacterized protein LOC115216218 [Argonauta hians]
MRPGLKWPTSRRLCSAISTARVCIVLLLHCLLYKIYHQLYWLHTFTPFYIITKRYQQLKALNSLGVQLYHPTFRQLIKDIILSEHQHRYNLLEWLHKVVPHFQVSNYHTCWNDGILLCGLLNTICPGLCPHFNFLQCHNRVNNCRLGLKLANDYLHIPTSLIGAEEIAIANNDETAKKIFRLAYMIRLTAEQHKWICCDGSFYVPDKTIDTGTLVISGLGYKHATVGKKSQFTISQLRTFPTYLNIHILGPNVSDEFSQKLFGLTSTDLQSEFYRLRTNVQPRRDAVLDYDSEGANEKANDDGDDDDEEEEDEEDEVDHHMVREEDENDGLETIPYDYRQLLNDRAVVSYIPRKTGVHYISVQQKEVHIEGSPFRVIVNHPISAHHNSWAQLLNSISVNSPALWEKIKRFKVKKLRIISRTVLPNKTEENADECNILSRDENVIPENQKVDSNSSYQCEKIIPLTSQTFPVEAPVDTEVFEDSVDHSTSESTSYSKSSSFSSTSYTEPIDNTLPLNTLLISGDSPNEYVTPSTSPRQLHKQRENNASVNEDESSRYKAKLFDKPANEQMPSNSSEAGKPKISIGSSDSAFSRVGRVSKRKDLTISEGLSKYPRFEVDIRKPENNNPQYRRSFSYISSSPNFTSKSLRKQRSMEVYSWLDDVHTLGSKESPQRSKFISQRPMSPFDKNIDMNEFRRRKRTIKEDSFDSSSEFSSSILLDGENQSSHLSCPNTESQSRPLKKDKTFSVQTPTFSELPFINSGCQLSENISPCCYNRGLPSTRETSTADCEHHSIWQHQQHQQLLQGRCKTCIGVLKSNQINAACLCYQNHERKYNTESSNDFCCQSSGCHPSCGIHSRHVCHTCNYISNESHVSSAAAETQQDENKLFKSEVKIFLKTPPRKCNTRLRNQGKNQNQKISNCENSLLVKKRKLLVLHNYDFEDENEATVYRSELSTKRAEIPAIILEKVGVSNQNHNQATGNSTNEFYVHNWLRDSAKVPVRQLTMETNDSGIAINSRSPSPQRAYLFDERNAVKRNSIREVSTPFTKYSDIGKKESKHFNQNNDFIKSLPCNQIVGMHNFKERDGFKPPRCEEKGKYRDNFGKHSPKNITPTMFGDLEEFLSSELYNGALKKAIVNPREVEEGSSFNSTEAVCQNYLKVPPDCRKRVARSDVGFEGFSPEPCEKRPFKMNHSSYRISDSSEKSGLSWNNTLERRKSDIPLVGLCNNYYDDYLSSNRLYKGSSGRQYKSYSHGLNQLSLTDPEEESNTKDMYGGQSFTSLSSPAEQNSLFPYLEKSEATNISSLADVEELTSMCEPSHEGLLTYTGYNDYDSNSRGSSRNFIRAEQSDVSGVTSLIDYFNSAHQTHSSTRTANKHFHEQRNPLARDGYFLDVSVRGGGYDIDSELTQSSDEPQDSVSRITRQVFSPSMECLFTSLEKAIAESEERPDSECYALGPGLEFGYVKTSNFFQVRTLDGSGPLTVGIQGPPPGNTVEEISIIYTDHCTYDVSYYVTRSGCYTLEVKYAGRHIFQSPFFCQILPLKE